MKLSLRFVLPLILVLAAIAYIVAPLVDQLTLRWFMRDLDMRSSLIARTIQQPLLEQLDAGKKNKVVALFNTITKDERLYAIGYCASPTAKALVSRSFQHLIHCENLDRWADSNELLLPSTQGPLHVSVLPMASTAAPEGRLVLVHDMSFITHRSEETKRYLFYFFMGLALVISLITVIIAQLSWRGWMSGMRSLLRGEGLLWQLASGEQPSPPEFKPIARDLQRLVRELESETRARDEEQITWSPESLRSILHSELRGEDIIVVSNREPYIHQRIDGRIEVQRPASGLVTALEPIMRACSGTWIAHGSGTADREVVDRFDRVAVPPETPAYQIRRVWLSKEEEKGYYYGFSNEGLWPLCHIAHVRPTFRTSDWTQYVAVNRKFAKAVVSESRTKNPIVLVQDYHFALLPKMIREVLPDATIITFWHIPWPNPESFAICPWRDEVLEGMLGSSILGFHTQFHCNNFVDTVDRFIEARVDRESFTVSYGGKLTAVRRYPISIEWPPAPEMVQKPVPDCRSNIRQLHKLPAEHKLGVGVDRLDYTKGITERFHAIERLLELNPEWVGRFTFVQIAAPTRSGIEEYQHHESQVRDMAMRINSRFDSNLPPPIVLKVEHHEPREVYEYFRAADLCFVSSLHDGMNLVAKEFVAARDDDRGVLILSQFTGAARELPEALIVNPYDADQCAAALHLALTMPADEQRDRMRLMRGLVAEFNVFRWAGRMLLDAAAMRRRSRLLDKNGHGEI
ncbi:alpha,alpha-trehalose-phosphate synthase (UDP-forming) [Sideroxydans lithotrophicus]|uniref:Alpha,alpha-trehalose-phosphate synthase (UDP-forming) n=1 Tax=Sideroxydans lithotrophicus (strain ES-1) TaxID=580332 RepID=D5CN51_SIDLE|nr:trehalose-6-phosphate synthase [Sideroxydans lithotrophicus]ADE12748.1 Alpha,alpha-trehalose-phosphate synthase (UDP-forming) [Sideroxydans lithotrophicus ES-1]